ncbi:MAG: MDR family MFS transporter [Gammaproteobacteria bacterium]|nr:MFS transporter [Pseudomonadales bacterium]MCP5347851.1 MFS transporter [Pseudomonadales bacterium]
MEKSPITVTDQQKRITIIALLTVFLLSALDMTILSTAMPRIIEELEGLELYAWVTTAYMLASTVLVPIYGKLGDLYGRKRILVIGISIFLLGSMLCGISGEFGDLPLLGDGMHQLIAFRAVKGIGGAALFTSAIGIIADLFPPLQRAKFMGLFGAVFGVASVLGPALGGFLTDFATVTLFGYEVAGWRWVFYANVPLGLVALAMVIRKMPNLNHGSGGRIDFLGAALLILTFVPFLLALTWGGSRYEWSSPTILGMFGGSLISLLVFIWVESRTEDAIIPLDLFRNSIFTITNCASFVISMAFLGVVMFMPLFMQVVLGVSATNSGFSMFPLMAGLMFGSILSGRLVSRSGQYKPYMIGGCSILVAGVILLTRIDVDTSPFGLAWRMAVVGLGLGPSQSLINIIIQNAFPPSKIGVATSSTQFFRQIGNTVGVAVFGTLLTLNLSSQLSSASAAMPGLGGGTMDLNQAQSNAMNPAALHDRIEEAFEEFYLEIDHAYHGDADARARVLALDILPAPVKQPLLETAGAVPGADSRLDTIHTLLLAQVDAVVERIESSARNAFSGAITSMFGTSLWIILLGFVITLFIPVIPLQDRAHPARPEPAGADH